MKKTIKVVVAKLGLDIHWRGAVTIARMLRDEGMDVVFLGNQFPEQIVEAAMKEGAHVVGLSTSALNHAALGPKVVELLRQKGLSNTLVLMGGVIPPDDIPMLKQAGIAEVFGPEDRIDVIASFIRSNVTQSALTETPSTLPPVPLRHSGDASCAGAPKSESARGGLKSD